MIDIELRGYFMGYMEKTATAVIPPTINPRGANQPQPGSVKPVTPPVNTTQGSVQTPGIPGGTKTDSPVNPKITELEDKTKAVDEQVQVTNSENEYIKASQALAAARAKRAQLLQNDTGTAVK
jgi:hypothetical protein